MKSKRGLLFRKVVALALCVACAAWLYGERQQYVRNRQLIAALMRDDTQAALALVNAGADPNTTDAAHSAEFLRWRLQRWLHRLPASTIGNPSAFLIACGGLARPTKEEDIHAAKTLARVRLVQAMLAHGADVQAKGWVGGSALLAAVANNHLGIAELLLQWGMNVNAGNAQGLTPLHYAAMNKSEAMTRLLLSHGANPNAREANGGSALQFAVAYINSASTLQLLLDHGADPNLPDRRGSTPIMTAKGIKRPALVRLLEQGAK